MQIYINCEFCGTRLGGWVVSGREQTLTVRPCYSCMQNIYTKASDIVERRSKKKSKKKHAAKRD